MFKNIIWATDGSANAERALATAVELIEEQGKGGKLFVVHANEILGGRAGGAPGFADEDEIRAQLRAKVDELVGKGIDAELHVVAGVQRDPADLVAEEARDLDADVIVVGTRGYGRVSGMLHASVTQRLLHVSPCPILAVPVKTVVPAEPAVA